MLADRTQARIAAIAQRVLIVDPQPASTRLLSERLRDLCHCQIWTAASADLGFDVAARVNPYLLFVGQGAGLDGAAFTRALRRSEFACRKAPVILISAEATAAAIVAARDAGVHELLRKPVTAQDLIRHLEAVAARPRHWVEGVEYVGPDRRRFNSGDYPDRLRRVVDHAVSAGEARVGQALRILRAAAGAAEDDPRQALRAMIAQAGEIEGAARTQGDGELGACAAALGRRLADISPPSLRHAQIEPLVRPLLSRLPSEESSKPAAA